ncbi:hypothetical protein [Chryseobacterium sp. SG20098]|uniref:hypothetical protein n=1 Tax=Chryseobacterium sp. SG20098 TaxID=3074145 RepID=UPI002883373C|nr:hypothetical protein [Chryseobacterium sp. SG20098]WNI34673.1 hypothetical protein RHP76_11820 [Chryseobacterium sp. SG20098]
MKLQSMVEFVLLQKETSTLDTAQIDWYDLEVNILSKIRKYALFISRSPTLEMFVPVDQDGNVLEEPMQEKYGWLR